MVRRALSLIELLIAIAVLGVMLAVVLPATIGQLSRQAFSAAQDQLQGQALLIRAHAMSTGQSLEWRYHTGRRVTEARPVGADDLASALRSEAARSGSRRSERPEFDEAALASAREAAPVDPLGSWAHQVLPRGVRITDQPPHDLLDDPPFGADIPDPALEEDELLFDEDGGERTIRLAVFLPDGSVLLTRSVWLRDDEDLAAKMVINAWTSRLEFTRITPATSVESEDEDAETPEEDGTAEPDESMRDTRTAPNGSRPPVSGENRDAGGRSGANTRDPGGTGGAR